MEQLERYRGHFYNWYDTRTLQPLPPAYVHVDSGNLAGHLLTLRAGLRSWPTRRSVAPQAFDGLRDTLSVAAEAPAESPTAGSSTQVDASAAGTLRAATAQPAPSALARDSTRVTARRASATSRRRQARRAGASAAGPTGRWCSQRIGGAALPADVAAIAHDWRASIEPAVPRVSRCRAQDAGDGAATACRAEPTPASTCRKRSSARSDCDHRRPGRRAATQLARMDFTFLFDPARDLFAIGYNVAERRRDASYYDLLASEARCASYRRHRPGPGAAGPLVRAGPPARPPRRRAEPAVVERLDVRVPDAAAGDADLRATRCSTRPARPPSRDRSSTAASAACRGAFPSRATTPTDAQLNYQYRAFGVPGLGFKRGLADDLVIAPYATALALMVDAPAGLRESATPRRERLRRRYGFYEAMDYTPRASAAGHEPAPIVRSFMAHHQGMSLLALAQSAARPRRCSGASCRPAAQGAELLLQERVPKPTPRCIRTLPRLAQSRARRPREATSQPCACSPTPTRRHPRCTCCPTAAIT